MTAKARRILIVDDHAPMRDGLSALLSSEGHFEVVEAIADHSHALEHMNRSSPDIVLISLSLFDRDGIQTISHLKQENPDIKVVALTLLKESRFVQAALDAGADAYVLKDDARSELLEAMASVADGRNYVSPSVRFHLAMEKPAPRGRKP